MSAEDFFKVQGSSTRNEVDARFEEYARIQRIPKGDNPLTESYSPSPEDEEALLEDREDLDIEATTEELNRAERVAARNQFILDLRSVEKMGWVLSPQEQNERIRQYDREHPL